MAAGDIIYWADVALAINPPLCRLVQTVAQTGITDNTVTAVTFPTEVEDDFSYHSTSVNTSRVTPTVPGWHRISGGVCATGQTDYSDVEAYFRMNGTTPLEPATMLTPSATSATLVIPVATVTLPFNGSTDYVELMFRLNRTGNAVGATAASAQRASALEVRYDRPL